MIGTAYALIVNLYNKKSGAAKASYPIEVNKLAHKYGLSAMLGKFALVIRYLPPRSHNWCSFKGCAVIIDLRRPIVVCHLFHCSS